MPNAIITATGSFLPPREVPNSVFLSHRFFGADGKLQERANPAIVAKLEEITGIRARRYASEAMTTSDLALAAAERALEGVDRERLDYLIVAHNFGDVHVSTRRTDQVPNIASRVKQRLRIENPYTVAYDLPFGCPGWLLAMIQANYFIRSGDARRALVIGVELASRVVDPHDMDCMIFADGAGAAILEAGEGPGGILAHATRSDTLIHGQLLRMGPSYNPERPADELWVKMDGHKIYKYAVRTVPQVARQVLEKAGCTLKDVSKVLVHQANEKMDQAILNRLVALCGDEDLPADIMPMTIGWAGNSSVATLPTMLDLICRRKLPPHQISSGDLLLFASVGAGMHISCVLYKVP
ncbi:MAG: ketoacyl-ACP synthase III [Desulfosarcinaceae bacterium]|nr:ketoacyl-ACP synthase III [Desulfosarcinaceae bacterium]